MATYYRGPQVLITHGEFRCVQPQTQCFRVRDLREVSVTCGRDDGSASRWWSRMVWELRAMYRGRPVLLYSSSDERTFGQVRRALVRALEANFP
jgi:hypothetical protein